MKEYQPKPFSEFLFTLIIVIVVVFSVLHFLGCATESKRRALQTDNPNCEVTEDLDLKCPYPDLNNHP